MNFNNSWMKEGKFLLKLTLEISHTIILYNDEPSILSSDSKKLKRRYGLAFEKFRDIRDIYRVPNQMSGVQGCICKLQKVREIPHLSQETAGFRNLCAGFSV